MIFVYLERWSDNICSRYYIEFDDIEQKSIFTKLKRNLPIKTVKIFSTNKYQYFQRKTKAMH